MAYKYESGCIGAASIKNGELVIEDVQNTYSGSKRLMIYDNTDNVEEAEEGITRPLYMAKDAMKGMICGYFLGSGIKHTVELVKTDDEKYWLIPEIALKYGGDLWLSIYGIVDDKRQMSNVVRFSVKWSNQYEVENVPYDGDDWREVINTEIKKKFKTFTMKDFTVQVGSTSTTYNGSEAKAADYTDAVNALIDAKKTTPESLTMSGNGETYAYNGEKAVNVDLDSIIESKGYQTASDVSAAITAAFAAYGDGDTSTF